MIPAFDAAMKDRALRGHAREIYYWMHERLDVLEYRFVKHTAIETELGISDTTIARAIDRLVTLGYIEPGERVGRLTSYRLLYSPRILPKRE